MANKTPKVTLYLLYKTPAGWKRHPAAIGRNNKVRPGYAQVGKTQVAFGEYGYQLRWAIEHKTHWEPVGKDATDAWAARDAKEKTLKAQVAAEDAGAKIVVAPGRVDLKKKATEFVQHMNDRGKDESVVAFYSAFDGFMEATNVRFADELTEQHITRWYGWLRKKDKPGKKGSSERTIANKHQSIFQFLRWCKVNVKELAERRPKFTKKIPVVYSHEEMTAFFEPLKEPYHRMVFETLLKTGLRMQEGMFMRWQDIDFAHGVVKVKERDEDGREIKDREEREVPMPKDLLGKLKVWQEERKGTKLVLGTRNDTPNWKWLDMLKRLARKNGMNCGQCFGCKERGECENWTLKKFRATYLTWCMRSGIDPRTLMHYSGHSDLETLLKYLSPAEMPDTQRKVNSILFGV